MTRGYFSASCIFSSFSSVAAQFTKQSQSNDPSALSVSLDSGLFTIRSLQIFVKERKRAFPSVTGSFLIVGRSGLVEKGVLCSLVDFQ